MTDHPEAGRRTDDELAELRELRRLRREFGLTPSGDELGELDEIELEIGPPEPPSHKVFRRHRGPLREHRPEASARCPCCDQWIGVELLKLGLSTTSESTAPDSVVRRRLSCTGCLIPLEISLAINVRKLPTDEEPHEPINLSPGVDARDLSIDDLEISDRVRRALRWHGLRTVADLEGTTEADLLALGGIGIGSVVELRTVLARLGIRLSGRGRWRDAEPSAIPADREEAQRPIDTLGLRPATRNALAHDGIEVVGDLLQASEADLMEIHRITARSVEEMRNALRRLGLSLRPGLSEIAERARLEREREERRREEEERWWEREEAERERQPHRQRALNMHEIYAGGASLREVGLYYGVTGERVRQLFGRFGLPTRSRGSRRGSGRDGVHGSR